MSGGNNSILTSLQPSLSAVDHNEGHFANVAWVRL